MNELDITSFKIKNKAELMKEIELAVNDTQRIIIRPYPSVIKMTREQYELLQHEGNMMHTYKDNDQLYRTKYNVMEVLISI